MTEYLTPVAANADDDPKSNDVVPAPLTALHEENMLI